MLYPMPTSRRKLAAYTLPMAVFLAALALVAGLKAIGATVLMMSVYPSGDARAAISIAIWPDAPERLSTMICWPSPSVIFWPITRAEMSVPPPGGKGTSMRIGRVG